MREHKRGRIEGVCRVCLLALASMAASAQQDVATLGEILAVEQTWLESQQTNNPALIEPLLAETIVDTMPDGTLLRGKAAVLADARSVHWDSAQYSQMQVSVYGDTAIATAIFDGRGKDSAGQPVHAHERYTDTWVRRDGHWQCVASHGSALK